MCDTLVSVGDDGILFAKNSDRDPNEAQLLEWNPSGTFARGDTLRCTWIDIPQVQATHATLLSRPWWMWGAEMGASDKGVVIGNEAVFTKASVQRNRSAAPGLLGMDLVRLGLERAGDAGTAVNVIVDLLERFGQSGPASLIHPGFTYDNSFIIADPKSAYVLETAGRQWAVEEVRAGVGRSISNLLTIEPFASVHGDPLRTFVGSARRRCKITTRVAAPPTSMAAVAATLRSHGDRATIPYSPINGHMSAPCMHSGGLVVSNQTVLSWISRLGDPRWPAEPARHWATATAAPCTSIFKPISLHEPLDLGPQPDDHYDDRTLWWRHERLHRLAVRDIEAALRFIGPERDALEREWFTNPPPSATAFEIGEQTELRWLNTLTEQPLKDARPRWVKALARLDARKAGMPADDSSIEHTHQRSGRTVAI